MYGQLFLSNTNKGSIDGGSRQLYIREKIMKKNNYVMILSGILLLTCNNLYLFADEPTNLAPIWKVGDSWSIKATWYSDINFLSRTEEEAKEKKRREYTFLANFKVTKIINTNDFNPSYRPTKLSERARYANEVHPSKGYECFEIEVTFPNDNTEYQGLNLLYYQSRYLLYFRTEAMNLIRVLDNSIRADGSIKNDRTDYPMDPNGPLINDVSSRIPFDWPDWRKKDIKVELDINAQYKKEKLFLSEVDIITQQIKEKSFSDKDGKSYDGFEISMVEKRREDNKEIAKIITKWKKGLPWWSERKKYDDQGNITEEMEIEILKDH